MGKYYEQVKQLPKRKEVYLHDELCKLLHTGMENINLWEDAGRGGKFLLYPGFPRRTLTPKGESFKLKNGKNTCFFWWRKEIVDWIKSTGTTLEVPPETYRVTDIIKKYTSNALLWYQEKKPYPQGFPECHKTLMGVTYFYKREVDEWFTKHPEFYGKSTTKRVTNGKNKKTVKLATSSKVGAERYVFTKPAELASPLMGFVVKAVDDLDKQRVSKPLSYDKACFLQEAWEKLGYKDVTMHELREEHAA